MNNRGEQSWSSASGKDGTAHRFEFAVYNSLASSETFALTVLESDWSPSLSINSISLLSGQSANVTLTLNPPSGASDTKQFNVAAFRSNGALYGGIFHRLSV